VANEATSATLSRVLPGCVILSDDDDRASDVSREFALVALPSASFGIMTLKTCAGT